MTNRPHRTDHDLPFTHPRGDEGSSVRERTPSQHPSRKSDPNLSLDQRLVSKLAAATELLSKLDKGAPVTLQLRRGENQFFATLRINNGD